MTKPTCETCLNSSTAKAVVDAAKNNAEMLRKWASSAYTPYAPVEDPYLSLARNIDALVAYIEHLESVVIAFGEHEPAETPGREPHFLDGHVKKLKESGEYDLQKLAYDIEESQ